MGGCTGRQIYVPDFGGFYTCEQLALDTLVYEVATGSYRVSQGRRSHPPNGMVVPGTTQSVVTVQNLTARPSFPRYRHTAALLGSKVLAGLALRWFPPSSPHPPHIGEFDAACGCTDLCSWWTPPKRFDRDGGACSGCVHRG